ncbi:RNA polymerase sigma-70 factor (ECF subfamily) [Kribbella sp. VKM Ac-2569]|uniref:sigma-70 family RNA polymerase sigma factor n=1 Tax=Kribbella sp. VKM Ac-2569 TaxID=2512220 RepID=UPI00102B9EDD|nr:sigma-70 family RNA polymerase sigma factor [Kribbella sp. VKM Ac-2569]RZT27152.1 RNA polymerase sigma-70 factor (ECF subfamily) [Kribbella sp. VKM Ac-2569]
MDRDDFDRRAEPYRHELLVHCYRMLGSIHDAEDLVQETLLRAWRASGTYDEQRASLRTWLYRIATNACLTALKGRGRRALPSGLVSATEDAQAPIELSTDVSWLQPFPTDPAAAMVARGSLRLALIAAMQYLPARQRAVLVLRDVLDWPVADIAEALETTSASVNSALQRARAKLAEIDITEDDVDEPADREVKSVIDDYIRAFEAADVDGLTRLLTDQVVLEMPPAPLWYVGRDAYGEFMARVYAMRGPAWRLLPTVANDQPAIGAYVRGDDGRFHAHSLQVFTVAKAGITHNVVFFDQDLFEYFGLPSDLE